MIVHLKKETFMHNKRIIDAFASVFPILSSRNDLYLITVVVLIKIWTSPEQ